MISPPISLASYKNGFTYLALNLGFEGLLAANINLDLLGFGFCLLWRV